MSQEIALVKNRRSIRKYLSRQVPKDVLFQVLQAAEWAPSAHNAQPWRFMIITEDSLKQELAETMASKWVKDMARNGTSPETRESLAATSIERFTHAPVLIVACLTMENMDKYPDKSRQECEHDMAVQSLASAIQNLLLAACSKNLGACWFCAPLFCKEIVRRVLKIPEEVEPQALITLGYSAEKPVPPPRKSFQDFSYFGHWGEKL